MTNKDFWLLMSALVVAASPVLVPTCLYWKFQFDLKADGVVSNYEQARTVYYRVDGKPVEKVSR